MFFQLKEITILDKNQSVNKCIVLFLFFHICVGILSPTIVILLEHSIEESLTFINAEKDLETEEEEVDKTVIVFFDSDKECYKNPYSLLVFWKQNPYQDIFLNRLRTPPEFIV